VGTVTAFVDGDTVRIVKTGGSAAVVAGGFQQQRVVADIGKTLDDSVDRYNTDVVFTFAGELQAVASTETFTITLNGVTYSYKLTPAERTVGTQLGERNLWTIARGLAQAITGQSPIYDATFGNANGVITITITDQNVTDPDGIDPFTLGAERGGTVTVVIDIDEASPEKDSFQVVTGYEWYVAGYRSVFVGYDSWDIFHIFPLYESVPVYATRPIYETVTRTISHKVELLDGDSGAVLAGDWANDGSYSGIVDVGSNPGYDPFLQFEIPDPGAVDKSYQVRVSSVINYSSIFPQYHYAGVWWGQGYDLIISLPGHEINQNALELTDKTLTVVEGPGRGQTAVISAYDPETKAYALATDQAWTVPPDSTSRYEITTRLSVESQSPNAKDYNGTYLGESPVIDQYTVVLTARPDPGKLVLVDAVPVETRTYNADEAFNPDEAFGQNDEVQVHVATDHAVIELTGGVTVGEYWIIALSSLDTKLGVDTLLQNVTADLSDGMLSGTTVNEGVVTQIGNYESSNNAVFVYKVAADDTLQNLADAFQTAINGVGNYGGYTSEELNVLLPGANTLTVADSAGDAFYASVGITPDTGGGHTAEVTRDDTDTFEEVAVELTGRVATGETWKLTLDDLLVPGPVNVTYTTAFGDDLSDVARELGTLLDPNIYDVVVSGRVLTISNATADQNKDITAVVTITPDSLGSAVVIPQLVFTDGQCRGHTAVGLHRRKLGHCPGGHRHGC